ncbi:hypothetical protein OF83DRAFT_1107489 [Amylostereum chailletii]|nr:hypothetical protein OF83DRAFT_1107489 [Amylostereum chailletii]
MSIDAHVRRGHPITLGLLTFFGIIELAIAAWLTSRYNSHHNYPFVGIRDRTTFLLFTSAWTVVFSLLFVLLFMHSASTGSPLTSVASHFVVFLLTWLFWTAGAASLTAGLGGGLNCSAHGQPAYCNQLNALEAFAWVEWVIVTVFLVIVLLLGIRSLRRGDGYRGQMVSSTY